MGHVLCLPVRFLKRGEEGSDAHHALKEGELVLGGPVGQGWKGE